jgi:hypothetical protein
MLAQAPLSEPSCFTAINPSTLTASRRVLAVYERARIYAIAHPDQLAAELVDAAGVSPEVAHIQLAEWITSEVRSVRPLFQIDAPWRRTRPQVELFTLN